MSALVVDSSSWISYFAGRGSELIEEALEEGRVYLPPIVAAELCSGTFKTQERTRLFSFLSDLPMCGNDLGHWLRVGSLRVQARHKGLSVSTPDAHVAQCTLDLGGKLLTEDRIFHKLAKVCPLLMA